MMTLEESAGQGTCFLFMKERFCPNASARCHKARRMVASFSFQTQHVTVQLAIQSRETFQADSARLQWIAMDEYHWEWNFPATPTTFAIRTDRYKFIYYHGVWDHNGFYDLKTDPSERHNLINVPGYQKLIEELKHQMFSELEASGGLAIPVRPPKGDRLDQRKLKH